MLSPNLKQSPGETSGSSELALPAGREIGEIIDLRYRIVRPLGRGGMGSVLLVEDLQKQNRLLALKQVRQDKYEPKIVAILRNEYLALSSLQHPNLARVYDFGLDRRTGEGYFTSEYVEGLHLLEATGGFVLDRPADLQRLLSILVEILRALEYTHSRGLVHGDLKPENLLVAAPGSTFRPLPQEGSFSISASKAGGAAAGLRGAGVEVKLIDFGLTKREKDFGGKKIFGTSYYIAPETILGSQVDRRTDLYSLGAVFYQAATGRLPFTGDSNLLVLKGHLEIPPAPPSEVKPSVPKELSEILLRLLAKKPADRYSSAAAVIQDINDRLSTRFPIETPETTRSYLSSAPCIARERELRELRSFFHSVFRVGAISITEELKLSSIDEAQGLFQEEIPPPPSGRFFLIQGEEGIGKLRLIREFKRHVEVRGVRVVEMRLTKEEAREKQNLERFLRAISGILSVDSLNLSSSTESCFKTLLEHLNSPEDKLVQQLIGTIISGLLSASRINPVVLVFSRLDRSGDYFIRFLSCLIEKIAQNQVPEAQIMILAAVEDEELGAISMRRLLLAQGVRGRYRTIILDRLSEKELAKLLDATFGSRQFSQGFLNRLFQESDGNPGVANEIFEHFIKNGKLERTVDSWKFLGDIEQEAIPGKVRGELRDRIQNLDIDAQRLGIAFALLGNSCELEVASQLAGIQAGKILPSVLTLRDQRLLREDGDGKSDRFSFTHRSAREIFAQLATPDEQIRLHLHAGELLKERARSRKEEDPRRIAHHFLRAGSSESGIHYGLMAARKYTEMYLPVKALEVYREVRDLCTRGNLGILREIDRQMALLESTVGSYRAAVQILEPLLESQDGGAPAPGDRGISRADILIDLASLECRLGEYRRSTQHLQEAHKLLKDQNHLPARLRLLLGFAYLFHNRGDHSESLRYCERLEPHAANLPDPLSRRRLYLLMVENHFRLDNLEAALAVCRKGIQLSDQQKEKEIGFAALTLLYLARYYQYTKKFEKALKLYRACSGLHQKIGVIDVSADCHREMGAIHLQLENPAAARSELARALDIYERTENHWGGVETHKLLGEVYRQLGRYEEAQHNLDRALERNQTMGNSRNQIEIYFTWSRLLLDLGDLPRSGEYVRGTVQNSGLDLESDEALSLASLQVRSRIAIHEGDFRQALDLTALGMIRAREVKNPMRMAPILELRSRVYQLLGRHAEARRTLNGLIEIGKRQNSPVIEARGQLLEGISFTSSGSYLEARAAFERALAVFKEWENERELARLYLEYGIAQLQAQAFEQSFVLFEEGYYLAKKLNLIRLRCRYLLAMGTLESLIKEGVRARAEKQFLNALSMARKFRFKDLLWQAGFCYGRLLFERDQFPSADKVLGESLQALDQFLEQIPEAFRESYCAATGAAQLRELLAQVRSQTQTSA